MRKSKMVQDSDRTRNREIAGLTYIRSTASNLEQVANQKQVNRPRGYTEVHRVMAELIVKCILEY